MNAGVKTNTLTQASAVDLLIANRNFEGLDETVVIAVADLAQMLLAGGPLATAIDALEGASLGGDALSVSITNEVSAARGGETTLAARLAALVTLIGAKAAQADLTAALATIGGKVSQSTYDAAIGAIAIALAAKADQAAVDLKADQADFAAVAGAIDEAKGPAASLAEAIAGGGGLSVPLAAFPGNVADQFTDRLDGGAATALPRFPAERIVRDASDQTVAQITGGQLVAQRQYTRILPGHQYLAEWRITRSRNTTDPAGDAILNALACYGGNQQRLVGEDAERAAATILDLTVASGAVSVVRTFSLATGSDILLPAGCAYIKGWSEVQVGNSLNEIAYLAVTDVTHRLASLGVTVDAAGLLADRDDHDAEAPGYVYLANDDNVLTAYIRKGAAGVWQLIGDIRGPAGAAGSLVRVALQFSTEEAMQAAAPSYAENIGAELYIADGDIRNGIYSKHLGIGFGSFVFQRSLRDAEVAARLASNEAAIGAAQGILTAGGSTFGSIDARFDAAEETLSQVAYSDMLDGLSAFAQTDANGHVLLSGRKDGSLDVGHINLAPSMDATFASAERSPNGTIMRGARRDGSFDVGHINLAPSMDGAMSYAERTAAGQVLRGSRHDGSVDIANLNLRPTFEAGFKLSAESGGTILDKDQYGVSRELRRFDIDARPDGTIWLDRRGDKVQLTSTGGVAAFPKFEIRDGAFNIRRSSDRERYVFPLAGNILADMPPDVAKLMSFFAYGQSKAAGNASGAVVNNSPFSDRFLMPEAGLRAFGNALGHSQERSNPIGFVDDAIINLVRGFEQLIVNGSDTAGETICSGFAWQALAGSLGSDIALLGACPAMGSTSISMLNKNALSIANAGTSDLGDPWRNLDRIFVRFRLLAAMLGYTFYGGPLLWDQGQGNYPDSKTGYMSVATTIQSDWQSLQVLWNCLQDFAGFPNKVPLIMSQMTDGAHYGLPTSKVPSAQLQLNFNDNTKFLCSGPTYDQPVNPMPDGVHGPSLHNEMNCARMGVAFDEWSKGNGWHPLSVCTDGGFAPVRTGATVNGYFWNHFSRSIIFDTGTVTGLSANQGIDWYDDSASATSTNLALGVTASGRTAFSLTLSGTPSGANPTLRIGMNGTLNVAGGPTSGNRTAVRTNGGGHTTRGGRAVEHPLCVDEVPVT